MPSPDVGGSTHVCFNTATYQVIIQSAESKCSSYLVLSGIYSDDQPPIAYQLRSSPVRRPTAHLTALRAWCTRCLPVVGENPTCSVPALWECEGHTAMVSRLRTATHEMSTPPPPTASLLPLLVHTTCANLKKGFTPDSKYSRGPSNEAVSPYKAVKTAGHD